MAKPGKAAETHRKRHLADMSGEIPRPAWVDAYEASDPDWDDYSVTAIYVGSDWDGQVFQRVRRHPDTRQIVDFATAIQVQPAGTDEGWVDMCRVDCAHGEVHVHDGDTRETECVPMDCRENLDRAYSWAIEYVWDIPARLKGLA